ncbi:anaphase-promoting complex, cyclosome, subunit 3 [bacterium BMS3Abin05]|nr:anaphase-promoting complex, cyclosome, subunit 3 [bacterium BMS3Abin05]GBE27562.1 anaphase-promoting complex, cyclosome, subunit 3 [bacterium BMS3Bbin03]HDL78876.1 hypothetical protein [Bacteroidota bacterium]
MKRIQLLLIFFLFYGLGIQNGYSQESAGQAGEFLRYGVHARALGMGRAYTGLADGAAAIYWNPAGLATLSREGVSATIMLTKLYANTSYNYLGLAVPMEIFISALSENPILSEVRNWNIGFAYLDLNSGNFEERTDANYFTGRTFSDVQRAFYITMSRSFYLFGYQFGAGSSLKFLSQNLFQNNASAAAVDFGLKFYPEFRWFQLGVILKNFNRPDLELSSGGKNVIPFSVRSGIAITPQLNISWLDAMLVTADYEMTPGSGRSPEWFLGFEYDLRRTSLKMPVKLRAGTNSTAELFTFGLSLNLSQNTYYTQFNEYLPKIDWAYLSNSETALGTSAGRFSLDFNWTPLTAQHWYSLGIKEFRQKRGNWGEQEFALAVDAKNPKLYGYPISAYLRLGDIEVRKNKDIQKGLIRAKTFYDRASAIQQSTREIDSELNYFSFLNYVQGLILNKEFSKAVQFCNKDVVWVNHQLDKNTDPAIQYLKAYALYRSNRVDEAVSILERNQNYLPGVYLLSRIYIDQNKLPTAQAVLAKNIYPVVKRLSEHIYLPYFKDKMVDDDLFLLKAYVDFRLADAEDSLQTVEERSDLAGEFLDVRRYFPDSDTGNLFTTHEIAKIVEFIKRGGSDVFEKIFDKYRGIIL